MIIEPKSTTIAYRCPACGGVAKGIVGIFSLSGDMFKLKCSCGNSHMTVLKENDQLRLIVPCVSCPVALIFALWARRIRSARQLNTQITKL